MLKNLTVGKCFISVFQCNHTIKRTLLKTAVATVDYKSKVLFLGSKFGTTKIKNRLSFKPLG